MDEQTFDERIIKLAKEIAEEHGVGLKTEGMAELVVSEGLRRGVLTDDVAEIGRELQERMRAAAEPDQIVRVLSKRVEGRRRRAYPVEGTIDGKFVIRDRMTAELFDAATAWIDASEPDLAAEIIELDEECLVRYGRHVARMLDPVESEVIRRKAVLAPPI